MKNVLIYVCISFILLLAACGGSQENVPLTETAATSENQRAAEDMNSGIVTDMSSGMESPGANRVMQEMALELPESSSGGREAGDIMSVNLTAGDKVYEARFFDNETANALMEQMPMELAMEDLNGNEKYYYLPDSLPVDSEDIGSIHAGDIMLFGSDCLVLFYEDFQTAYSYTRIGYVEEPAGLSDALGNGSVNLSFERAE